jgi:3-oxoacyl-(acyl-carrier-protein) synthase
LQVDQLEFFEENGRLKSASLGRAHGLSPAEATGFIVVESERAGRARSIATILGVATTDDPTPRSGPAPSTGQALTQVIREALASASISADQVDSVVCDLDGEFARSKEWGYADLRVLDTRKPDRLLLHPADCFGAIGTAFPVVLLSIIAASRGWLDGNNLAFASDDDGPCGAAIVHRSWRPGPTRLV